MPFPSLAGPPRGAGPHAPLAASAARQGDGTRAPSILGDASLPPPLEILAAVSKRLLARHLWAAVTVIGSKDADLDCFGPRAALHFEDQRHGGDQHFLTRRYSALPVLSILAPARPGASISAVLRKRWRRSQVLLISALTGMRQRSRMSQGRGRLGTQYVGRRPRHPTTLAPDPYPTPT